jgi:hypothetical protein
MNNTANLRRIDTGRIADAFPRGVLRRSSTSVIFSVLMISFRPFNAGWRRHSKRRRRYRQSARFRRRLAQLSIAALMTFVDRRVLAAIDQAPGGCCYAVRSSAMAVMPTPRTRQPRDAVRLCSH